MLFDTLSILITDRCNASCEICCLNCSPGGKQTLETAQIEKAIRQAAETEGMEEIRFTGGEPFLYADRVEACAAYAAERGLRSVIHTNGFWGADERKAAERTRALKEAGVVKIHFSADPYHQKYVPFSALEAAMRLTREAGIETELSVMEINGSRHWQQALAAMPEEIKAAGIITYPLLPVGRAAGLVREDQLIRVFAPDTAECIYSGMASLTPDGCYHLCCTMYFQTIPRISLGHMDEVSFSELEAIVLADDYLYLMLREGFGWYMQKLREHGRRVPESICFPCVCCEMVFRDQEFLDLIAGEVHERAQRLRQEAVHENS